MAAIGTIWQAAGTVRSTADSAILAGDTVDMIRMGAVHENLLLGIMRAGYGPTRQKPLRLLAEGRDGDNLTFGVLYAEKCKAVNRRLGIPGCDADRSTSVRKAAVDLLVDIL